MKRLSLIAMLSVAILSAGCSETQQDQIAKVREFTVRLCNFLPTAQSVGAILTASNPQITGTLSVAQAICDAVGEKPMSTLKAECPQVNGVCIEGEFVGDKE